jgi:hypothetical protein
MGIGEPAMGISGAPMEIGRKDMHDWPGAMWSRRYQPIVVSDEEAAQVERLRYHLAHGVKECLVFLRSGLTGARLQVSGALS